MHGRYGGNQTKRKMNVTPVILLMLCASLHLGCAQSAASLIWTTTIVDPPMVMFVKNTSSKGNTRYKLGSGEEVEGFIIDILGKVSEMIGADFEVSLVQDGRYGSQWPDGTWSGMIGELATQQADVAAASLTATVKREAVVDFTQPFMEVGLKFLIKTPSRGLKMLDPQVFLMLYPFQIDVWLLIILVFSVVSVVIFCIKRFNPRETCTDGTSLTLQNSFFFVISTFMWQGYAEAPKSLAGRTMAAFWWAFTLFVLVTYTSSLTCFLLQNDVHDFELAVSNFKELSQQTDVKFGMVAQGATETYFAGSDSPIESRIWNTIRKNRSLNTDSYSDGVNRVLTSTEPYAFIMEQPVAEYFASQECELEALGDLDYGRSFAFATTDGFHYNDDINKAILSLKHTGVINDLKTKWFTGQCETHQNTPSFGIEISNWRSVGIRRFAVPCIILLVGLVATSVIFILEIFCCKEKPATAL